MRAVAIVPYIKKERVAGTVKQLVQWLEDHQINPKLPLAEAEALGYPQYGHPTETLFEACDLVIALGGDGTALRAARLMQRQTLPLFGVNLGEIGFLMRFGLDELFPALERVIRGEFKVEERRMALARIKFAGGATVERLALNDVLVGREEFSRLVKLDLYINDHLFNRYAADGLIVATPTGSTAYSFSAGGPFVSPASDLLLLTPICPHSLMDRSLILSPGDVVKIRPAAGQEAEVRVSLDGMVLGQAIEEVTVSLAGDRFKFVVFDGPDFYVALQAKLKRWMVGGTGG